MTIKGAIALLIILLFTKGFGETIGIITTLLDGIWQFIKMLVSIAVRFPDMLGITDLISAGFFFLILTLLLGAAGVFLTVKQEHKLFGIIVDIVAAISLLLTFAA